MQRRLDGPLDDTVPAVRRITLRDLLTFTFGFGVVMAPPGSYAIQQAIAEAGIAPGPNPPALTLDALAAAYGALPLMHQPGERWMYNSGTDLVAVAVQRAAGRPFEAFLAERIFAPLGMKDTGFGAASAARERLAGCYQVDEATGGFVPWAGSDAPPRPGGSTGLASTVDDYLGFARMLLAGGGDILTPASVAQMTGDQLTPAQKAASPFIPGFWDGRG
ncbi:MAG: beta-lactamase [Rhodospirillales bacterium]|nr:beta-lactamase [Rhodospirillales bacterium]